MKTIIFLSFCSLMTLQLLGQRRTSTPNQGRIVVTNSVPIKIKWTDSLMGNFSFRFKWEYPEDIYKNDYGQPSCNGSCPEGVERMIDSTGKIIKDSIKAFYKIVDTTHIRHSISCTAWCYEWAGTDFIEAVKKSADTVFLSTALNAGTHCSLQLSIFRDYCYAVIDLNSTVFGGSAIYYSTGGFITIDKTLWQRGIVKAIFSFNFRHDEDPKTPIFWKGKIYSKINPESTNR